MPFEMFDRSRLVIEPLENRQHDLKLDNWLALDAELPAFEHPDLPTLAERIVQARRRSAPVILMMGAHLLRAGVSRYIIDLMRRGVITHVGTNGAVPIHDFELALIGATTESVARYIRDGRFGLWRQTGRLNDIIRQAVPDGIGMGEAIGRAIATGEFPHKELSIFAAAYELKIPITVHVGIGYDIIHEHPNCDGAALGEMSYRDFLIFAHTVEQLEGGVSLNYGTAVMGPEVYLKALSMARNVARQQGRTIRHFTTAVFDLAQLPSDYHRAPDKSMPQYYFRPWKTVLVRTVQDGGESFYFRGDHRLTFTSLYHRILEKLSRA